MSRSLGTAIVVFATVASTGCASIGPVEASRPRAATFDPRLDFAVTRGDTALENEVRVSSRDDGEKKKEITPALFWTGVILGSIGTVGLAGFGGAAEFQEAQLRNGYEDGITSDRADGLVSRGETYNALAITSATVGVIGWTLAVIVAGIDYSRCGPMAPKSRKCDE